MSKTREERTPGERVCHLIELYLRDILGPSAMWLGIAGELTPQNARATLEGLPEEKQRELRGLYFGIPPHAYIAREPVEAEEAAFQAVCVRIVEWCEEGSDEFKGARDVDDGLTRVVIRDGLVRRA
jgi:hypothetical protein